MAKRSRDESVAAKILQRILRGGADRLWGLRDFLDIDTATAAGVAATLSVSAGRNFAAYPARSLLSPGEDSLWGEPACGGGGGEIFTA